MLMLQPPAGDTMVHELELVGRQRAKNEFFHGELPVISFQLPEKRQGMR
jgi:hypothetical protein